MRDISIIRCLMLSLMCGYLLMELVTGYGRGGHFQPARAATQHPAAMDAIPRRPPAPPRR